MFVAGGAWFVAKSMVTRGIVLVAGLAAVGAYLLLGKPNMHDEPLESRVAEIEKKYAAGNYDNMTPADFMALAEKQARLNPKNPRPHIAMGRIFELAGQPQEAQMAYEAALRRDPNEIEAISRLADIRFKMTGEVDAGTSALYHEWYRRDPTALRPGYMAGIGDWVAGRKDEAQALWAEIDAKTPKDGPYPQMFAALRQMFGVDPATPQTPDKPNKPG